MKIRVLPVGVPDDYVSHLHDDARLQVLDASAADAPGGADALIYWLPDRDQGRALMDRLGPGLRWVHVPWVGVERLLTDRVRSGETVLTNSRGAAGCAVAEYVTGCVIAHAKSLPDHIRSQSRKVLGFAPTREIRGQTVLVVGLGDIGKHVARNLRYLGMRVRAVTRTPKDYWACESVAPTGLLEEEIAGADFVVLCAPSTDATRGLFNAGLLRRCRPGACLINVARGDLVDTDALCEALRTGPLSSAYLDVFEPEPLDASNPLWELDNVVLTPHISSWTQERFQRAFQIFQKNVPLFLKRRPLLNQVRVDRGY